MKKKKIKIIEHAGNARPSILYTLLMSALFLAIAGLSYVYLLQSSKIDSFEDDIRTKNREIEQLREALNNK